MTSTIATTTVTIAELDAAQGGVGSEGITDLVTVECPVGYDVEAITADDIIHDSAITVSAGTIVCDDSDIPQWAQDLDGTPATPEQIAASARSEQGLIRITADGAVVEGGADTARIWIAR